VLHLKITKKRNIAYSNTKEAHTAHFNRALAINNLSHNQYIFATLNNNFNAVEHFGQVKLVLRRKAGF